ncbi:MAG: hypothetical protein JTT11_07235 [Candidatus Brockarchaeota archaeon]|nr:hypothetical protein [Candidatus Brockarchaeota archaeon]
MFGVKFTKRDVVDFNLCFVAGAMMILSILVRLESVWKPAIVGASTIIAALAVVEAGVPNKRRAKMAALKR